MEMQQTIEKTFQPKKNIKIIIILIILVRMMEYVYFIERIYSNVCIPKKKR